MHWQSIRNVVFWAALLACVLIPVPAAAEDLIWNAAGTPANSFELTDGPSPDPPPADQVFTAENPCDDSTVTATFSDPDDVADVGEPFVDLRTAPDTIDWWIDGPADNGDELVFTLDFGGEAVENLEFDLFDIDADTPPITSYQDRMIVTATFVGAINVEVTGGTAMTCTGDNTTTVTCTGDDSASFGAAAGTASITIPGPVRSVRVVYTPGPLDTSTALNGDQLSGMSDFTFDCTTVPVTLSSFEARPHGSGVDATWTTQTETANLGFHLYGEESGSWRRLNADLIPGYSIDSLVPRTYEVPIAETGAERFFLGEVDVRGKERLHGPFDLGVRAGGDHLPEPVDWSVVREQLDRQASASRLEAARSYEPVAQQADPGLTAKSAASRTRAGRARQRRVVYPSYEIRVSEDGLYRVWFEDVPALEGAPLRHLALTRGGNGVPIRVVGPSGDGVVGPGGFFEFYGQALDSLYTATDVLELTVNRFQARRIRSLPRPPRGRTPTRYIARETVEHNLEYSFASPNGDPWYEKRVLAFQQPVSETFEIEVDAVAPGEAVLEVDLWGVTDFPDVAPDHHVQILLNGVHVADELFNGLSALSLEIPIPGGLLVDGVNSVEVVLPGDTGADWDLVHVESYGVRYPRQFVASADRFSGETLGAAVEIQGFTSPDVVAYRVVGERMIYLGATEARESGNGVYTARLKGRRQGPAHYHVSTAGALLRPEIELRAPLDPVPAGPANYWILTHPLFEDHLAPLVAARRADGFTVATVSTGQVFREYGGGVFDPEAIRSFVGDIAANRGAEYLLLIGGDSYDYHDYLGVGSVSFIPTIYLPTHNVVQFTPSDAALADGDRDGVPDVYLGRLPVRSVDELETVIDKTLTYSPASLDAIFAADAAEEPFSFSELSDELAEMMPAGWTVERAYVDLDGVAGARATLLDAINSGPGLTQYFGHSGPGSWTFSGLLGPADPPAFINHGDPTVVVQWGCWNGYHSVPQYNTLAHAFLLSGSQGAAAVIGASTLTKVVSDREMAERFYHHLSLPGATLGQAVELSRRDLAERGYRDVVLGTTLLGDPALRLEP